MERDNIDTYLNVNSNSFELISVDRFTRFLPEWTIL